MSKQAPENTSRLGTSNADAKVRTIIAEMLKASKRYGRDRKQVADAMAEALGREVTLSMLGDFTRAAGASGKKKNGEKRRGRDVRFPAAWVPALTAATGSDKLVRYLMDAHNLEMLELAERQHLKVEWVINRLEGLYNKLRNANPQRQGPKRQRGAR